MSDTPRTDEVEHISRMAPGHINDAIRSEFARKLERENAALRADKERLDWLFKEGQIRWPHRDRAAIDDARKEQPKWPTLEGRLANKLTSTEEAITQLKNTVEISPVAEQILNKNKSK